jgi:hypothetical protein
MERIIEKFYADFQEVKEQIRNKDFENYQDTLQSNCYNPNKLLNALSKIDNAILDLKQLYTEK